MSRCVLFVSGKCPHSNRLKKQFPTLPSEVSAVDVHDPRARRTLERFGIDAVPSLLVMADDGDWSVFSTRAQVARVLETLAGRSRPQRQQQQTGAAQMADFLNRPGIDRDGPLPDSRRDDASGPCGFDGACSSELQDVSDLYQAPSAAKHSLQDSVMGGESERPQVAFEPPRKPLLPAAGAGPAPQQQSSMATEEIEKRLKELAKKREDYDRSLEARNRNFNSLNMAMRN